MSFKAIPGFYNLLFLYFEPLSTISPAVLIWFWPGASWFHEQLVPSSAPSAPLDPRTTLAVWQLGNCYMLLSLLSSFVFRAIRDTLPTDPASQERISGSVFTALAIADVTHVVASFIGLPPELRSNVSSWNATTHGNITFTVFLFSVRMAWFMGVGRHRYYYGQTGASRVNIKAE